MKKQLRKWILRLAATGLLIAGLLLVIILNPILTYAGKTDYGCYTIFHNRPLDPMFSARLDDATRLLRGSIYYNPGLHLDICLNDGSKYPALVQGLAGQAFARGFYNKVVFMCDVNCTGNSAALNGYRWNLTQLLAHEMMHCVQLGGLGLRQSNPVAGIPAWKWEGYPEYIARRNPDQTGLAENITRLIQTEQGNNNGWIQFADSTGTLISYYRYRLLIQYSMEIKGLTYAQILDDTSGSETVTRQMMHWYGGPH